MQISIYKFLCEFMFWLSLSLFRSFVRPLTRTLSPLFDVPFFFSSCLSPLRSLLILFNFKLFSTFPSFSFKPIHFALLSHIVIIDSSNIAVFLISNGKLNHFHQSFFCCCPLFNVLFSTFPLTISWHFEF